MNIERHDGRQRDEHLKAGQFRRIKAGELDFSQLATTKVISAAQKFIIPVPPFGESGEPLLYPQGHEQAGQPILNWEKKPIGTHGIVFWNEKDKAWQAARGDGQAVIILNQVSTEQAALLYDFIRAINPDPNKLRLEQVKVVLDYAAKILGLKDVYDSNRAFIQSKMTGVGAVPRTEDGKEIECFGHKKRDERDICQAVFVEGRVLFEGPTVTPQVFENGAVIVKVGQTTAGVQPDIFMQTYLLADGGKLTDPSRQLASF